MKLTIRKANESDCDLLFRWANDPVVRQNAFNTGNISYEEHVDWFRTKVHSDKCIIFIACLEEKMPAGQIRIDLEDNFTGIISYSISKEYRGMGFGTELLKIIPKVVKEERDEINKLVGKVKHVNEASKKAFEKAGFDWVDCADYVQYYKLI